MRYAIVGTGSRHAMYREALVDHPIDAGNELVALCDSNPPRLALAASHVAEQRQGGIGLYRADEFDRMIAEERPDTIIVTTPDFLHDALHRPGARGRLRRHHRKADDDRPRQVKGIVDAAARDRPAHHGHLQLPLRPCPHPAEGRSCVRRHRRDHLGGFPLVSRPRPRRRLLPPLAPPTRSNRAACSSTRRPTISISSTGGSRRTRTPSPRWARVASTRRGTAEVARPRRARRAVSHVSGERACPYRLDLAGDPELRSLYLETGGRPTATSGTAASSRARSASRTRCRSRSATRTASR